MIREGLKGKSESEKQRKGSNDHLAFPFPFQNGKVQKSILNSCTSICVCYKTKLFHLQEETGGNCFVFAISVPFSKQKQKDKQNQPQNQMRKAPKIPSSSVQSSSAKKCIRKLGQSKYKRFIFGNHWREFLPQLHAALKPVTGWEDEIWRLWSWNLRQYSGSDYAIVA